MINAKQTCPCGSDADYEDCCGPCHQSPLKAPTAEALMRARYSAYAMGNRDFVLQTWHPDTRPAQLDLEANNVWKGLVIHKIINGGPNDTEGMVEFTAMLVSSGTPAQIRERSQFLRGPMGWQYVDGELAREVPVKKEKIPRNAPCPCGSGKKFKRCCGR